MMSDEMQNIQLWLKDEQFLLGDRPLFPQLAGDLFCHYLRNQGHHQAGKHDQSSG